MNPEELSRRYMEKYDELIKKFEVSDIDSKVLALNEAIDQDNISKTNELYNEILEWNALVEKLEGARIAIDTQYHYLRLPSPSSYSIIFDFEDKTWKFNTIQ